MGVFDYTGVREAADVRREAATQTNTIHFGRPAVNRTFLRRVLRRHDALLSHLGDHSFILAAQQQPGIFRFTYKLTWACNYRARGGRVGRAVF